MSSQNEGKRAAIPSVRSDDSTVDYMMPGTAHIWHKKDAMFLVQEDGSLVRVRLSEANSNGDVVYFSGKRFVSDICGGDACFMCGRFPSETPFNNEHVIPKWLLRHCELFDRTIALPNGRAMPYRQYTVPCCSHCNTFLGTTVEEPMRELLSAGFDAFASRLHAHPSGLDVDLLFLVFRWMCLLFVKTHLKDRLVPRHLDQRKGADAVAAGYDWSTLHHAHCVARSFYTGAVCEMGVLGSMFVAQIDADGEDQFDYSDQADFGTMLLRIGNLGLIMVMDDSGGINSVVHERTLSRVSGSLTPVQFREVLVDYSHANRHMTSRPTFHSLVRDGDYAIEVRRPKERTFAEFDHKMYKELVLSLLGDAIRLQHNVDELLAAVDRGTFSFLFDNNNEFIGPSKRRRPHVEEDT